MPTWNSSGSTKLILMEAILLTTQHVWKPCKSWDFNYQSQLVQPPIRPIHPPLLNPPSTWSVRLTKSMMGKRNGLGPRPLGWVNGSCEGMIYQIVYTSCLEMLGIVGSEGSINIYDTGNPNIMHCSFF